MLSGSDLKGIDETKKWLNSQLHIKDLGNLQYFLGIAVNRNQHGLLFSQQKYVEDLILESGCQNAKGTETALEVSTKLEPQNGEKLSEPCLYKRIVGKLIYLTVTIPDIAFVVSVNVVSQFMQEAHITHWIIKYLKQHPNKVLFYWKDKNMLDIQYFVDANWAGNIYDRRSKTGHCITLGGNLVIWKSKVKNICGSQVNC